MAEPKIGQVKEYGLSWLISNKMGTIAERLRKRFCQKRLQSYHIPCLCGLRYQSPYAGRGVRLCDSYHFYRGTVGGKRVGVGGS